MRANIEDDDVNDDFDEKDDDVSTRGPSVENPPRERIG